MDDEIVNKCWDDGKQPEGRNRSVLRPIFEIGDKTDSNNYRGVALMTHLRKNIKGFWRGD